MGIRATAYELLQEAAQTTQILLLTCHPERFLPYLGEVNGIELAN